MEASRGGRATAHSPRPTERVSLHGWTGIAKGAECTRPKKKKGCRGCLLFTLAHSLGQSVVSQSVNQVAPIRSASTFYLRLHSLRHYLVGGRIETNKDQIREIQETSCGVKSAEESGHDDW